MLNIWVYSSDGSDPVQLTSFERRTGTPRWSPDGRRLVFDSIEAGDWNLYVVDADGGALRRLTPEPSGENSGTWSRDGRWVYFSSNRSGSDQIWRVQGPLPRLTSGRTSDVLRQVGTSEHMWLAVSPDEQWVLYSEWPEVQSELMLVENFR